MEASKDQRSTNIGHQQKKSMEERMEKVRFGRTGNAPSENLGGPFHPEEVGDWITQQNLSKTSEDILGQSTPVDTSLEDAHAYLDVSRVEVAGEMQKQQCERLEKLWKHQSQQNQQIFEKLDESMVRQKRNSSLREQHARQMEDLRLYYEGEISGLKIQMSEMKSAVFQHNKHEDLVKTETQKEFENLSTVNIELSSKCDALEASKRLVENQLKQTARQKQDLETQCQQLMATNQIIDTRSQEIKKIKEEADGKLNELQEEQNKLASRCDVLAKERAILKSSKEELERNYIQLQEDNQKLTDKCHKWKEESRIFRDRNKTQEKLLEKTNKNVRELERVIETLKRELEDSKVKSEVDRSLFNATQQRVDRLVVQNRDKDLIIQDLEIKVQSLEAGMKEVIANTAKAGLNEIKESVKRDKEVLKRVVREYDSLNTMHEHAKDHVQDLQGKLAESQGEGQNLRKELSELNITRKNLENSLREVLGNQNSCRQIVERSSRRTWQQSESFNFFTGEPFRIADDVNHHSERRKLTDNMESTRRESTPAEKDELVDLSPIQSRTHADPVGYTKECHDSRKFHPHFNFAQDDKLRCSFCNQNTTLTPSNYNDGTIYDHAGNGDVKRQSGSSYFKKHSQKYEKKKAGKEKDSLFYSKGNSKDKSKAEADAIDRRAFVVSAEKRFLELSEQRRNLEAALVQISTSRMSKQNREDKKFLENKLDEILKEMGKIRLQLKVQLESNS